MGEAKRVKEALLKAAIVCNHCPGSDRFSIEWYSDRHTRVRAVAIQKGKQFYIVRPSVEKTKLSRNALQNPREWLWIHHCMRCGNMNNIPVRQVPLEGRIAGYWSEEVHDGRETTRADQKS